MHWLFSSFHFSLTENNCVATFSFSSPRLSARAGRVSEEYDGSECGAGDSEGTLVTKTKPAARIEELWGQSVGKPGDRGPGQGLHDGRQWRGDDSSPDPASDSPGHQSWERGKSGEANIILALFTCVFLFYSLHLLLYLHILTLSSLHCIILLMSLPCVTILFVNWYLGLLRVRRRETNANYWWSQGIFRHKINSMFCAPS